MENGEHLRSSLSPDFVCSSFFLYLRSYRATVLLPETTLSLRAFYGYRNRRHRPRSHYALSSSTLLQLLTLLRYLSSPSSHLQLVYLLSMDPSSHLRNHLRNHQANSRIGVYYSTRNTTILGIFGIPSLPLRGYIPPPYWIVHAPYDDDGWCWLLRRSYGVLYLGISVVMVVIPERIRSAGWRWLGKC
ncbi:hypothetical protein F5877DRAFT_84065 [Lentinula edodes]|nr:hypothetical protein F5877DRAFT_84065 [Lentinula edodes]